MKKKVLIVDDELSVCNMLKKFLTIKGYSAIIALSGKEAIIKLKRQKPSIVLLDIKMPDMDGIEVLKRIKKINKKIPIVIMVTAIKDDEIGRKCMELGAADYITKPISLEYLENVLLIKILDIENNKGSCGS